MNIQQPNVIRRLILALVLAGIFLIPTVKAQSQTIDQNTDEGIRDDPFLTVKHSGYFRMRSDLFYRGDLGNGVSGLKPPLENTAKNQQHNEDGEVLAGANLRLRWSPELSIGQRAKVGLTLDVLDNMVLGSTPDYDVTRADVPLAFMSESQSPDFEDSIRVKQVWGEWSPLSLFRLRAGRMSDEWGLGMVHNAGDCIDCDFGDTTDRASIQFEALGYESMWFMDYPAEGATIRQPLASMGQAYDGSQADDVVRWGFTLGTAQVRTEFQRDQRKKMLSKGTPIWDFGFRNTFVSQDLRVRVAANNAAVANTCTQGNDPIDWPYECVEFLDTDLDVWQPNIWARFEIRPSYRTHFRAEFEAAAVVGEMKFSQGLTQEDTSRDLLAFGGVLQLELTHGRMGFGLESGFATGDEIASGPYGTPFNEPDDGKFDSNSAKAANKTISNFVFDRDYHVDLLLYRQVLGAVTNSTYVKANVLGHLLKNDELVVGGDLSVLYGHALETKSTPGQANSLGLETDLRGFVVIPEKFRADLEAGVLVPFSGLSNYATGVDAQISFTVQGRLTLMF